MLDAIRSRRPILVRGLIGRWMASSWTFDSLRAVAGDRTVKVLVDLPARGGVLEGGQEAYEQEMPFALFLDRAEQPDCAPCYLAYTRPGELIRGSEDAFDFSPITIPCRHPTDTRLWVGSTGTCSGLHSDLKDNVFAQISGQKRLILVPFRQTHLVYPFLDNIANSRIDPEHLDTLRFPRFLEANVLTSVLGPGDVVYIPRGWWHYLRSESPSISINHWFGPPVPGYVFLALLVRLGWRYLNRAVVDLVRYSLLGGTYRKDFFFTPPSTGERLFNLIRHGDFSRDNDPATDA
ncbi:cupin-like domain-containing protein [Trebonia sp.]|uniref:cupin-like domain-containing protein n=1 Tax=Trebonia sp. TaxID=2767075 RepID=UPI002636B4F6|nr:cupin-like domain-containing protein [Trebonia sp.]